MPGSFDYDPPAGTKLDAGTHPLKATFTPDDSANYNGASKTVQLDVNKAEATLSLDGLQQTYDGDVKRATATTDPTGLSGVSITYDGFAQAPTDAGSYAVEATLDNANYQAQKATGTLVIAKANQTISFGGISDKTYGDANFAVSARATSGLPISFSADGTCSVNQNGVVSITGAGGCTITASQAGNGNYNAAQSVAQSFQIAKAQAQVSLSDLAHDYDGTAKSATVATTPAGLKVDVTYDGSPQLPTNVGSYAVSAKIDDANYQGSAQGTLKISAWTHKGFYNPVDMGIWNTVKAGSTVPMKFEVFKGATELKSVSDIKSANHKSVPCSTLGTSTADAIEATTTGSTSLRFDTTSDQFIFNWKTQSGGAVGSCYVVTVVTQDGTPLNAYFKMK